MEKDYKEQLDRIISQDRQRDCILCMRKALDIHTAKFYCVNCSKCGWNIIVNRERKLNDVFNKTFKQWKKNSGAI